MLLAVAWVGVTLGAAWVSVDQEIPYDLSFLSAAGTAETVGEDWLRSWGTGLAAPLGAVAAVAVFAVLASMDRSAGRLGAFTLAVLGALSVAFTASNGPTMDLVRDTSDEPVQSALVISTLALGALLVVVGFTTWLTAPRERYL